MQMSSRLLRYRGDTDDEVITLITRTGKIKSIVNLDSVNTATLAYNNGTLVKIAGVKDSDPSTGRVTFSFDESQVDTVGEFDYDVQVVYTNGKKRTFVKSVIEFEQDVNTD